MSHLYPPILDPNTPSSAERRLYEAFVRELNDEWLAKTAYYNFIRILFVREVCW
jgi:hypothetical protein